MTRTKVALEFFLPTGSFSRINDAIEETRAVLEKHKSKNFFITYSGPFPDDTEAKTDGERDRSDLGRARGRDEAAPEAGADEAPAEPVKRGRGRPRKSDAGDGSAEAPRSSAGRSDEGERAEGRRGREGARRDEPRGADEGAGEGRGSGEGRARSAGRDRDAERGDPVQARVKPAADDWDDEAPAAKPADGPDDNTEEGADWWCKTPGDDNWPDHLMPESIDKDALKDALSEHFEQSGDRAVTLTVLKAATGESTVPNVHPDDYAKAIKHLLKDAARIRYGVKR